MIASVIAAIPPDRIAAARSCHGCTGGFAVLLQMAIAVSRSGAVIASCIAVMPPMDTPATAARCTPAASSTASASSANCGML